MSKSILMKPRTIQMYAGEEPSYNYELDLTGLSATPKVDISKYITEIGILKKELEIEKTKPTNAVDPRDTHEYKLLKSELAKWTNAFNSSTYPTPQHVAKKITDLQTELASKTDISSEDRKKINNFDKLKFERDCLVGDKDNLKKILQEKEAKIAEKDKEDSKLYQVFLKEREEVYTLTEQLEKEQEKTKNLEKNTQSLTNEKGLLANKVKVLEAREKTNTEIINRDLGHLQDKIEYLERQAVEDRKSINNQLEITRKLEEKLSQQENEVGQDKNRLKTQLENEKRDKETKIEELKGVKWEMERIKSELEAIKNQPKKEEVAFNFFVPYTMEEWIKVWKQSNGKLAFILNADELFPYLESHREDYKEKYNIMDLNQISNKLLTKKMEQSPEWQKLQRNIELQKTSRSINDWFKEGLIVQQQLDSLHKLAQKGIVAIDFNNKPYTWEEVMKMILASGVID